MLPPIRTVQRSLDDLVPTPRQIEPLTVAGIGPAFDAVRAALRVGQLAAIDATERPHRESALADVLAELTRLTDDSRAHQRLSDALEHVVVPAIADATAAGVGVLIAYGPNDDPTVRPSVAIPRGQALLLRTDRVATVLGTDPIPFEGANQ